MVRGQARSGLSAALQQRYDQCMIAAIALILCCQLAGEALHLLTGLPLPGPVIGMVLLFGWLKLVPRDYAALKSVSGWLIANMTIMFIPATLGIVNEGKALSHDGLTLVVACIGSVILTMIVTYAVFRWVAGPYSPPEGEA